MEPRVEVISFLNEDIIATSNVDEFGVPGDFGEEGTDWE